MLTQKLNLLPSYQKHVFSLITLILCMAAAMGFSYAYNSLTYRNSVNITLIFTFFLIIVSCVTVGYLYGILFSLFAMLYFFHHNLLISDYSITFICMLAITIFVSTLSSHLTLQANMIADREKQLTEAEMEKMRANLLRAISHDLRTPLTGIIGNSAAFLENQDHLSEKEKRNIVTNIYDDSNWLINMVENLLMVTRIRNQDLCISTSEESIEEVVAEALLKMENRHPECVIHAKIPDELIMLPMDAVLIEQVTINLLENALHHSKSSDPIDFIVKDLGKEVSFTVKDYGVGIPAEKLNHLFDGMDYTNSRSADTHKGMGIGLAICKTIITAHHGTLIGRNHKCGAEFIFTLPKTKEETFCNRKEIHNYEQQNKHSTY